ncbi:MAG: ribosomal-processing cysteine protease Prp [Candidatus Faecenecus gallistercoris]|nr:ribosomal-processing cysteine protease Prp [Bacillota bacterium]MDD7102239.1 ribosomal-processing cysteine protease Prp [Bacillota bacterium]MDY4051488.1 ribosomal-processing cysteine protease Prp [Candidatus Faecenecus gallistercoris]
MIKVSVTKKNQQIQEVSIQGHAMYDDFGKDIVCAAVSSCVITTVNGILEIDKDWILAKQDSKGVLIQVQNSSDVCQTLLANMISLLEELHDQYPKNLKIISKEDTK